MCAWKSTILWESEEITAVPTGVSVEWKIRNFYDIRFTPRGYLQSKDFNLLNSTCYFKLYFGVGKNFEVELFLLPHISIAPDQKGKCKIFCKDKFGKEFRSSGYVDALPRGRCITYHNRYIKREDLLNGELTDLLLPEDTLTICCEMRGPDPEDAPTGSKGVRSEPEVISEAVATIYEETLFPDVTLRVGGEELPAHKAILSGRSSVFRGMFQAEMKESREHVAEIQELEAQTARQMLLYIYTGKVCDLENESAKSLYVASDRYDLPGLKVRCLQYLLRNLSVDNVCQLALLADLHADGELKSAVRRFIRKNRKTVLQSAIWKESVAGNPLFFCELISSVLLED